MSRITTDVIEMALNHMDKDFGFTLREGVQHDVRFDHPLLIMCATRYLFNDRQWGIQEVVEYPMSQEELDRLADLAKGMIVKIKDHTKGMHSNWR